MGVLMVAYAAPISPSSSSMSCECDDDADWDFLDDVLACAPSPPRSRAASLDAHMASSPTSSPREVARDDVVRAVAVDEGDDARALDVARDVSSDDVSSDDIAHASVAATQPLVAHTAPASPSSSWWHADAILDALVRLVDKARDDLRRAMSSSSRAVHPYVVRFARAWARMHRRVRDLMKQPMSWSGVVFVGVGVATGVFVLRRARGGDAASASAQTPWVDFDARMPPAAPSPLTTTTTFRGERSASWMTYTMYPYDKPFYLI